MLDQRRRRYANIKPASWQRLLLPWSFFQSILRKIYHGFFWRIYLMDLEMWGPDITRILNTGII